MSNRRRHCPAIFPLSVHAETLGENGSGLFYQARHSGIWEIIFEFHYYGYLILFARLIALLAVKGLDLRESFPFFTERFRRLTTGFFYAFFCLKRFRSILPSALARFLVASALGIGLLGAYENHAFMDSPYHDVTDADSAVQQCAPRPRWEIIALTTLVFLICYLKVHPVAFLPLLGVSAPRAWRTVRADSRPESRLDPEAFFLGKTLFALLPQTGTTLAATNVVRTIWQNLAVEGPVSTLDNWILYYFKTHPIRSP